MKKLYALIFTGMLFFTTIGVGAASAQYYQGRLSIPGGGSSDMTGSRMKVNATNNGKMSGVTSAWLGAYGRICHSDGNPVSYTHLGAVPRRGRSLFRHTIQHIMPYSVRRTMIIEPFFRTK